MGVSNSQEALILPMVEQPYLGNWTFQLSSQAEGRLPLFNASVTKKGPTQGELYRLNDILEGFGVHIPFRDIIGHGIWA